MQTKKGIVIFPVLAIIVVVLLIGDIFVIYRMMRGAKLVASWAATGTTTPQTTTASTTRNMGFYTNTMEYYSLFYPTSYHISIYGNGNKLVNYDETLSEMSNPLGVTIQVQHDTNTLGFDLSKPAELKKFIDTINAKIEKGETDGKETPIISTTLANIPYAHKVLSGPGGSYDVYFAFAKDGKSYYRILVWSDESNDVDQENIVKILSSFEVNIPLQISPAATTTVMTVPKVDNRNTYINTVIGFSFTYPATWIPREGAEQPSVTFDTKNNAESFSVRVFSTSTKYTFEKFKQMLPNIIAASTTVQRQPALKYDYISFVPPIYIRKIITGFFLPNGNFVSVQYDKNFHTREEADKADMSEIENMLKTLRF